MQADLHCRLQGKDLVVHIRHKINVAISSSYNVKFFAA